MSLLLCFIVDSLVLHFISDDTNKIVLAPSGAHTKEDWYFDEQLRSIKLRDSNMVFDWTKADGKYFIISKEATGRESQIWDKVPKNRCIRAGDEL